MVVGVKESFEKSRQVKKMINQKNTFYEDKEMQDIKKKFYQIKKNLIILRLSSVQKSIWQKSQGIASSSDTNHPTPQNCKSQGVIFFIVSNKLFEYKYLKVFVIIYTYCIH